MGKKQTLKCMLAFHDRDPWPSCLFWASAKSSMSSQIAASPGSTAAVIVLTKSPMRLCFWLKANSFRGLYSILPFQIDFINQVLFFPSHFPNNVCMSTELVAVHTHRSHTFNHPSSSRMREVPLFHQQPYSPERKVGNERVKSWVGW